eukprot:CAMPEP_0182801286 /NCGR_PEP_ID=MMETSP0006_2-20121128/2871_1 /TAXON_ID=97485 /ORGANISM="Prymnesium parvum, Strain Texoma1" /LENGTH=35 /DNA_ID= /DNA_START= /DNA_END= /DNA_ORIENTATION=
MAYTEEGEHSGKVGIGMQLEHVGTRAYTGASRLRA